MKIDNLLMNFMCAILPEHFRGTLPHPSSWGEIDDNDFYNFVIKWDLSPVVFKHWKENKSLWDRTKPRIRLLIELRLKEVTSVNKHRAEQICALLQKLRKHKINPVILKGLALSQHIYGNPFLRFSGDLDLLVKKENIEKVEDIFRKEGIMPLKLRSVQEVSSHDWLKYDNTRKDSLPIDLHWDLTPRWYFFYMDYSFLWENLRKIDLGGCQAFVMGKADTAFHLIIHNSKDYGMYNFRGPFECLECLGLIKNEKEIEYLRTLFGRIGAENALCALEAFRNRYFAGCEADVVFKFLPKGVRFGKIRNKIFAMNNLYRPGYIAYRKFFFKTPFYTFFIAPSFKKWFKWIITLLFPSPSYIKADLALRNIPYPIAVIFRPLKKLALSKRKTKKQMENNETTK